MLPGIPYNKFTVRKHKNIYRGHESCLSNWPDLSDPTVPIFNSLHESEETMYDDADQKAKALQEIFDESCIEKILKEY